MFRIYVTFVKNSTLFFESDVFGHNLVSPLNFFTQEHKHLKEYNVSVGIIFKPCTKDIHSYYPVSNYLSVLV